jgi:hypothetical protein
MMANKKAADPKIAHNVTVRKSLWNWVDAYAEIAGVSRSEVVDFTIKTQKEANDAKAHRRGNTDH